MKEMMLMIRTIVGIVGLGYLSVEDFRKKEITTWPLLFMGTLGALLSLLGGEWNSVQVIWRFVPGVGCLVMGWGSRESIGYGDGLVLFCLGCFLTLSQLLELCLIAVTLAGLAALFLLVVLRRGRKTVIPLIPFFLIGYGVTVCM